MVQASLSSLSTLPEILSALSSLESEESELSNSLSELLQAREPIISSLSRLESLLPQLDGLHEDARLLSDKVGATAQTAERVGGRVRSLDEEMRRIRLASDRVGQVLELKSSIAAMQSAIESQDWESATRHCARAMALPPEVLSGRFAETTVPTSENPLPPAQSVQLAKEKLLAIFRERFENAAKTRDAAATTRYFKLFPTIGCEAEGLEAYASFVVALVRVRAPPSAKTSSPLYYVTALTALFENIALIVDQHQPIVDKYYGSGKMSTVVDRLLKECLRVVEGLIEGWEEDRSMKRKLSETSNAVFHTLQASSPAVRRQTSQAGAPDGEGPDPREVDKVLTEAAGMAGRWSLLKKFLVERLEEEPEDETAVESEGTEFKASTFEQTKDVLACGQAFEDMLMTYYVPLEIWYTRTVIDKAHRLSSSDPSASPTTTTTPDDVFYIFKFVLQRLLSCGNVPVVKKVSELLRDVMDRDYAGVVKRKLDDVYRMGGSASVGRGERGERELRLAFIILLNDLDVSSSHMDRLIKDVQASNTVSQAFLDNEVPDVINTITSLSILASKYKSTLRAGIEQLFNQLIRPKLRTFLSEIYKDVSYVLDEESYSQAEYQDMVRKRFVKAWEGLVDGYIGTFTDNNYQLFFGLALDVLIRPWEKLIMTTKFTELGAIRFDRDLRAVISYLTSQTAFGDAREKFLRLHQISTLLNLDAEENVDEFYSGSGIIWKLSLQEARAVVALRV
ncbi:COG4-domain-containing protein [Neolentinus lepideus HHB14362 ss-1]|uniref:Conserved oligomeric Golgi complex subunit 4 n=1 Tax=Neolentinus lepideus HHB14362 ss-1 TaxID=1314782 RepID=A0A165US74_9AGAM|nr:COG4-domain-containing protein [Neolentinus lepideus HHB14362 ss-1]